MLWGGLVFWGSGPPKTFPIGERAGLPQLGSSVPTSVISVAGSGKSYSVNAR